eukprot:GHVU01101459.1.p1 GENE.GHVU01101459.1~~GHVU01101459.1.p1  ORF type:complete len:103 (-),score=5.60 GHVU01101459.1:33-341(-)
MTLTSQGHLVVIEYHGLRVDVYTQDLVYIKPFNVYGAVKLCSIISRDELLFLVDVAEGVHVMRDDGTYKHKINVSGDIYNVGLYDCMCLILIMTHLIKSRWT